jgi:ABC-type uncharacterized transport system auxiliary subunit
MNARNRVVACVIPVLLIVSGCSSAVRQPKYYTMALAPKLESRAADPPKPVTIAVQRFETAPYLRHGGIAYRERSDEVEFYQYHRWAIDPGVTVSRAVVDSLRASGRFMEVHAYDSHNRSDYLLIGHVERLDELDYGSELRVGAALSAELIDLRTGRMVWSGSASHTLKVDHRDVYSVVEGLSNAVEADLNQVLPDLNQQFPRLAAAAR